MTTEDPSHSQPDIGPSPEVIRRLPNVLCKSGLILLEGTLVLAKHKMDLLDARQIRERVDRKYLEGEDPTTPGEETSPSESASKVSRSEQSGASVSIPLENIESMTFEWTFGKPSLFLKWDDPGRTFGRTRKIQFIQRGKSFPIGRRLSSWVPLIDELKNKDEFDVKGEEEQGVEDQEVVATASSSVRRDLDDTDLKKLEEQLLGVLDKKEWKGLFQIVKDIRDQYGSDYDLDDVEAACRNLVNRKLLQEDKAGDFYKKT